MPNRPTFHRARGFDRHARHPYDATFALCYLANTCMMVAISLLFRYADFVAYFGGGEMELGMIVGTGMVGAVAMRVFQGVAIDRFGPRRVWLISIVLFCLSLLAHLEVTRVDTPTVYLLRVVLMIAVAGAFGASITFVSLRAPNDRMAELIGVLGSSGFLGIAIGPAIGDWIFQNTQPSLREIHTMFVAASVMGGASLACAWWATRHAPKRPMRRYLPVWKLLSRYHPGPLLVVSIAMGLGVQLPNVFLRPFVAELGLTGIRNFFLVYAAAAFATRLATRRWTDRVGTRPVALLGLTALAASMLLYVPVRHEWQLAVPAVVAGVAHAFLFPAVVSGGSSTFPTRYRGLATTLILATFDMGVLLGQPAVGALVHVSRRLGWPPYGVMFTSVSAVLFMTAIYYARASRGELPRPRRRRPAARSSRSRPETVPDIGRPSAELTPCKH